MTSRPAYPANVYRELLQACGFGCVVCGSGGLLEVHHDPPRHLTNRDAVHEMTLLCTVHHRRQRDGLLSDETIRKWRKSPYALRHGATSGFDVSDGEFFCDDGKFCVQIGSTVYRNHNPHATGVLQADRRVLPFVCVARIDEHELLTVRHLGGNKIGLDLRLYGPQNIPLLIIESNVVVIKNECWEAFFEANCLTVTYKIGGRIETMLRMWFCPPNRILIERAIFCFNDTALVFLLDMLGWGGNIVRFARNEWAVPYALSLGECQSSGFMRISFGEAIRSPTIVADTLREMRKWRRLNPSGEGRQWSKTFAALRKEFRERRQYR